MRLVIVESPYAADTPEQLAANVAYARACMRDCLNRGEAPFLSHLLYPQTLDDKIPAQHAVGMKAGLAWGIVADTRIVYIDRGISAGMREALRSATPAERRNLSDEWLDVLKAIHPHGWT